MNNYVFSNILGLNLNLFKLIFKEILSYLILKLFIKLNNFLPKTNTEISSLALKL